MIEQPITIAIVDDHSLFRSGLSNLLSEFDGLNVAFDASNGLDFHEKIKNHPEVQVVLMDINMPLMNGFETTKELKRLYPTMNVLALSMYKDDKSILNMLKAGASGYILKESKSSEVLEAIKMIVEKNFYINELVSARLLFSIQNSDIRPLFTEKEMIFLQFCSTELTYKEIADKMNISPRTVDNYRESLFAKLSIKSRTGLVVYAIKEKLITI